MSNVNSKFQFRSKATHLFWIFFIYPFVVPIQFWVALDQVIRPNHHKLQNLDHVLQLFGPKCLVTCICAHHTFTRLSPTIEALCPHTEHFSFLPFDTNPSPTLVFFFHTTPLPRTDPTSNQLYSLSLPKNFSRTIPPSPTPHHPTSYSPSSKFTTYQHQALQISPFPKGRNQETGNHYAHGGTNSAQPQPIFFINASRQEEGWQLTLLR